MNAVEHPPDERKWPPRGLPTLGRVLKQVSLVSTTNVFRLDHMLAARPSPLTAEFGGFDPGDAAPDVQSGAHVRRVRATPEPVIQSWNTGIVSGSTLVSTTFIWPRSSPARKAMKDADATPDVAAAPARGDGAGPTVTAADPPASAPSRTWIRR